MRTNKLLKRGDILLYYGSLNKVLIMSNVNNSTSIPCRRVQHLLIIIRIHQLFNKFIISENIPGQKSFA